MIEQRQFHRVKLTEHCTLNYQDTIYQGELDNISLNGAVISCGGEIPVPLGAICQLVVYLKGEVNPLKLNVEVMHSNHAMLGMRFVPLDEHGQHRLVNLVEKFTMEPDKLVTELDAIKWHIANYLRAS